MGAAELTTPLVVLAVLALVAFLVFKAVQGARRNAEERRSTLRLLGFEPTAGHSAADHAALVDLCRRGPSPGRFRVENLLERRGADHRVLLFDLRDTQEDEDRPALLAVTSPRLALPRFKLFPKIPSEGRLAAFANALLEKMVAREGHAVTFDDDAFSRRYTVVGSEEAEIHRFFDRERLAQLAERDGLMIDAEGRSFAVDRLRIGSRNRRSDVADVTERVEEAERLLHVFSRRP